MKVKEIQEKIKKEGLTSFFFSSRSNVFYLSRFHSSNAFIILTEKEKFFITDSRYFEGAKERLKEWNLILLGENGKKPLEHLKEIINEYGGEKIGFEEDKTTLSFYRKLKEGINGNLIGFTGFLDEFRISKTEEEIEIIREAVHKIDRVFEAILPQIKEANNELDLRRRIINHIFLEGGTGESFPAIVAVGKNSAVPHHETSYQKIEKDNPVLIDMGLVYRGYCSDFTRTVFYGNVNSELEKIYEIVKEAHMAATERVKAGIPIREIDIAARSIIKKYGYDEYFTHSTGHGIGIDIHEPPRIYKDNEDLLMENTVFTIEPGIYIPGLGGVRIENVVVARKDGAEVLTQTTLEKIII